MRIYLAGAHGERDVTVPFCFRRRRTAYLEEELLLIVIIALPMSPSGVHIWDGCPASHHRVEGRLGLRVLSTVRPEVRALSSCGQLYMQTTEGIN